jgi:hypothetical protein
MTRIFPVMLNVVVERMSGRHFNAIDEILVTRQAHATEAAPARPSLSLACGSGRSIALPR